jgi:molybdopterin-dependent oxidoreductase alpha subunit
MSSQSKIQAETPADFTDLTVSKPAEKAAGLEAIVKTTEIAYGKMGAANATVGLAKINQFDGFDCQSCAWADDTEHRKLAEFCENGAKALADEATKTHLTADFFAQNSVAELSQRSDYWLNAQGRITEPLVLEKDATHYKPITWHDAFRIIAEELNSLASPDEAIFYTSGRTSNEAAFLYQLFVRKFGTNNLPDCSNMCHESSGAALTETIGIGKGTVTIDDFDECDLIIILGQNPGTNHPRMLSTLEKAKQRGAKMISVNPLPEAGLMGFVNPNPQDGFFSFPFKILTNSATQLSDFHLPIRINGDMAFLQGVSKLLVEDGAAIDRKFIEEKTFGFAEFAESLKKVSWADITQQCGLSFEQISQAAEIIKNSQKIITCWAMGLTQHKDSVATIQEISNLHLLLGQIGKPGAGLCPVRGHSNVQGDRTVGIWEKPKPEFLQALEREFKFTPPTKHGFDTVNSIKAMHEGTAKVFVAMGGNFLSATPDTKFTAEALQKTNLTVQIITKLNRSALVTGKKALILPPLGRSEIDLQNGAEQFVTTENSMGNVQMSKGVLPPASENLRSEIWIVCELAKAVLGENWDDFANDYDKIRDAIERTIPGFENYNERVRQHGGFYLPNKPRFGEFPTHNGKANFTTHDLTIRKLAPDQFLLMTIRSHDQFNTTIYDLNDRYRGIKNERRVIFLNTEDMREFGFKSGQVVNLTSHFDDGMRHANHFIAVPYAIPRRCTATYFPEANSLVPIGSVAEKSNTPTSKSVVITITKNGDEQVGKFDYDYLKERN